MRLYRAGKKKAKLQEVKYAINRLNSEKVADLMEFQLNTQRQPTVKLSPVIKDIMYYTNKKR